MNPGWSILGVCRVDNESETTYDFKRNGVQYRAINPAEHLDPLPTLSPNRPQLKTSSSNRDEYL